MIIIMMFLATLLSTNVLVMQQVSQVPDPEDPSKKIRIQKKAPLWQRSLTLLLTTGGCAIIMFTYIQFASRNIRKLYLLNDLQHIIYTSFKPFGNNPPKKIAIASLAPYENVEKDRFIKFRIKGHRLLNLIEKDKGIFYDLDMIKLIASGQLPPKKRREEPVVKKELTSILEPYLKRKDDPKHNSTA